MKAVDTNVLARLFVDDPEDEHAARQRPHAIAIMSRPVFVSITVLLELEWVLRGFYSFTTAEVGRVLGALCTLENVSLENRGAVMQALEWHAAGMDFADAMHVQLSSARCESFVTFDKALANKTRKLKIVHRVELA